MTQFSLSSVFAGVAGFFNDTVEPFFANLFGNFVHAEAQALAPFAVEALGEADQIIVQGATSPGQLGAALGELVKNLGAKAEAAGIAAGATALLTTTAAAIANAQAAPAPEPELAPAPEPAPAE